MGDDAEEALERLVEREDGMFFETSETQVEKASTTTIKQQATRAVGTNQAPAT